ncbi:MAG: hypothetical protein ACE5IL_06280 [Myxococcota bacterium]
MRVDRTVARVGDAVGVTIEVDTPEGFRLERPAAPARNDAFETDRLESLEPISSAAGLEHRLLWVLRPRSVGEQHLPELQIPLVYPDGRVQPLPVGGAPLEVRSVGAELPEQKTFFDLRPAPEPRLSTLAKGLLAGGAAGLAGLVAWIAWSARKRPQEPETDTGPSLARAALEALERDLAEPEPRRLATRVSAALAEYAGTRHGIETRAATADELGSKLEPELSKLLREAERWRFERHTERTAVLEVAREAHAYLTRLASGQEQARGLAH